MNVPFRKSDLARATAMAAAFALGVGACASEDDSVNAGTDDRPDIVGEPATNDITGEQIEEAVPGIEEANPDGTSPNTADLGDEENAEFRDIDEEPPELDDM